MAKQINKDSLKTLDAEPDLKRIGARIKELRKKKGYTSYETFANEHDIHRVQWGRYEQGLDMYSSTLIKIVKLLDVSLKEFFSEGFD
jgi:transcriptional regulator with XRE-family HTH domain